MKTERIIRHGNNGAYRSGAALTDEEVIGYGDIGTAAGGAADRAGAEPAGPLGRAGAPQGGGGEV